MATTRVTVQHADFDLSAEVAALRSGDPGVGAVATFIGTVRDRNDGLGVSSMELFMAGAIVACVLVTAVFGVACVRYTRIFFGILTMALSQVLCDEEAAVGEGAEIGFFPPVTGG